MDWLRAYNPLIDWKELKVEFSRSGGVPVSLSGVSLEVGSARVQCILMKSAAKAIQ